MCGIAGFLSFDAPVGGDERRVVERMADAQIHRGPDAAGVECLGTHVVFGHRRLAILDLTPEGNQPMPNENASIWVVFNGEIYNYTELRSELIAAGHRFRSRTDTEVILHGYEEWGIDGLLRRLRGMFAFALYDARSHRYAGSPLILLARDRLGIKPLYYHITSHGLAFASEVQALRRSVTPSASLSVEAIVGFLCLGAVPAPLTFLSGVLSLPAGHYLAVNGKEPVLTCYWDFTDFQQPTLQTPLSDLLQDTVKRHLVADVPTGVFLSGGVDSSAITAVAQRERTAPVFTLTIGFDDPLYDEAIHARRFAEHFKTDHHEIRLRREHFSSAIPDILAAMDQPTADGVNTYFVSQAAKQLGLKVVLSGLGGDEIFLGYDHYRRLVRFATLLAWLASLPQSVRSLPLPLGRYLENLTGAERWARSSYVARRPFHQGLYLLLRGFYPPTHVAELLGITIDQVHRSLDDVLAEPTASEKRHLEPAELFQYFEIKRYLHDQLLRDSDVFSMTHSIELRVPFLDHLVVEAAAAMVPKTKITRGVNKPQLVNAVGDVLVEQAARRRKRGFTFPFAAWMKEFSSELEELALSRTILNRAAVRRQWDQFRRGRLHWSRAWATVAVAALSSK